MVVVWRCSRGQFRAWYYRCREGEHHFALLGVFGVTADGRDHCSHCESTSETVAISDTTLTQLALQSTILYSRYGNGIATNNLSKMIAGFVLPGRPIGNMYFAAWSHNLIINTVNLSNDLKMGEYRESNLGSFSSKTNAYILYSQNSSPSDVPHTNLGNRLRRFH